MLLTFEEERSITGAINISIIKVTYTEVSMSKYGEDIIKIGSDTENISDSSNSMSTISSSSASACFLVLWLFSGSELVGIEVETEGGKKLCNLVLIT